MKETFFIQVPKGLEALAKKEFELKYPMLSPAGPTPQTIEEVGGLLVDLPLDKGLMLNYWLKVPNRILLRFAHFRCRDIPKLYNKVSKLDWSPYFAGQAFEVRTTSHESRLFDDRKINQAILDGLEKSLRAKEPKARAKKRVQYYSDWKLFCRFENDWCTLSLDTSGVRLGLRGYKKAQGMAPLRENISAALFLFMITKSPFEDINDDLAKTLVDPFCGSGTLLSEAALFFEPNLYRNYAFEFFPLIEEKKNQSLQSMRPSSLNLDIPLFLVGIDKSKDRVQETLDNLRNAGIAIENIVCMDADSTNKNFPLKMQKNIFKDSSHRVWGITNPPYGKRVKTSLDLNQILETLSSWGPWERLGILLPPQKRDFSRYPNLKLLGELNFENGGEKVDFLLFETSKDKSLD